MFCVPSWHHVRYRSRDHGRINEGMADNRCKGCHDDYRVNEEQITRVLSSPMFTSDRCVPDGEYDARLHACFSCPKSQGDTTCTLCGASYRSLQS